MTKERLDRIAAVGELRLCRADFLDLLRLARRVVMPTDEDVERVARETHDAFAAHGGEGTIAVYESLSPVVRARWEAAARAALAAAAKGGDDG